MSKDNPVVWLLEVGLESLKTELDDYHNHGFKQGLIATVEQVISALEELKKVRDEQNE